MNYTAYLNKVDHVTKAPCLRLFYHVPHLTWSNEKSLTCSWYAAAAISRVLHVQSVNLSSSAWLYLAIIRKVHSHTAAEVQIGLKNISLPRTAEAETRSSSKCGLNGSRQVGSSSWAVMIAPVGIWRQQLHMQVWYRSRPSFKYGCLIASAAVNRLFCQNTNVTF